MGRISSSTRWSTGSLALLVSLCSASSVSAQQAAPTPTGLPDQPSTTRDQDIAPSTDIVVTANKREQTLLSVPASVTAVTGDQLVKKGINDVQDLVKVTPGLSYVESGRSIPVFSLRGVGYFDQSLAARPTVSVYVDEAPIPFSIEAKGASFDLERVEVLKGPQGTLFGQNATGGAINYIAAKPTSTFSAGSTVSYGRFNTFDGQAYVSGPLTSTLNARLAVRGVESGDWQRSYTRDDTIGAQRFVQGRLMLDWRPVDRLKVLFTASGFYDGSDTQAPQFERFIAGSPSRAPLVPLLATYPVAPANARAADWDAGTQYNADNRYYQLTLRADYEATSGLTLTSLTSWADGTFNQLADGDGTALTNLDSRIGGRLRSFFQELRGAGDIGRISYIAGINYAADNTNQVQGIYLPYSTQGFPLGGPPQPALGLVDSSLNQHFDTQAIFGNVDWHPFDKVTVHGGIRYTLADLHYDACLISRSDNSAAAFTIIDNRARAALKLPPLGALQQGQCVSLAPDGSVNRFYDKLLESNVSWRGGIDFKPTAKTLLYVTVSKGYKAGSSTTPAATNDLQFVPVTQESVLAYEAGLKTRLFGDKAEVTAAGFYYDYRNKQLLGRRTFDPNVFGAINALTNIPKSRILGAEAQVTLFPARGLRLSAAGTYLDTKVLGSFVNSDILGAIVDLKNDAFPYTPKYQIVLDGEYRFKVTQRADLVLGTNASYRSSTTSGFGGNSLLDIDAYWLLDARAGLEFGRKYRVALYGRNLTDTYYWTNVSRSVDNVRRYAGMPRTYGIQFSVSY